MLLQRPTHEVITNAVSRASKRSKQINKVVAILGVESAV